jgi:hypothetical protein
MIRNQIQSITQTLSSAPTFIYGTQNELNLLADDASFPCVFMYPLQPVDVSPQINGSVDNTFSVYLEFLYKTEFDQYSADNEIYVNQALQMANEFIVKAAKYREGEGRYFRIKAGDKARALPVYNKFDENIKSFVDSPAADVLTAIIPGDLDDELKDLLRVKLPAILTELQLADNCGNLNSPTQITACAINILQQLGGDTKSAFLHNLSILIAQVAADGKLSWSDGVYLLEWYYQNEYKTTG